MTPLPLNIDAALNWAASLEQVTLKNEACEEAPYMCNVIQPNINSRTSYGILPKTKSQINAFFKIHDWRDANCRKLQFFDVIVISRIYLNYLSDPYLQNNTAHEIGPIRTKLMTSLRKMASRADAKYIGFWGTVRKIFTVVCNFFKDKEAFMPFNRFHPITLSPLLRDSVPLFVGSDASFARAVANAYDHTVNGAIMFTIR